MSKFSFDPKPLGFTTYEQRSDMGCAASNAAFEPCVVLRPGIDALIEGLSLANIEGFPPPTAGGATGDVNR